MALSLDGTTGISASGNIVGNNISVSGSLTAGTFSPTNLVASGNITGGNILTAGLISATGNITGGNVLGGANVNATTHTGTTVSVTGNITGGNILTGGLISATSTITSAANVSGGNILTGGLISATSTVTSAANVIGGNITTAGIVTATGNVVTGANLVLASNIIDTGALEIITSSNGNITLSPNGSGLIVANKDIRNGQANGVGNIGTTGGFFNTIFAKSTSAQYADLAELYIADKQMDAGQVVEFGGPAEIQQTTTSHSTKVAGIVSSNPSYLMNAGLDAPHTTPVALTGRVPCYVIGSIRKGDRLVSSSTRGVATALDMALYEPGCIIGKALEDYESQEIGRIEVAVGRF